jgi:heterotetrameric sarcosine oxidase gamma subunit
MRRIEATEFKSDTLALEKITELSIARLQSLRPQPKLPSVTGQCSSGDPAMLCLRPGEWLSISGSRPPQELVAELERTTEPEYSAVYDNTHGLAVFRLSGKGAPWLLSKLSGLDYLAGQSAGAHCAQTRMGHISALVYYHNPDKGAFVFDLIIERSYAVYFWKLLTESSAHADDLALAYGDAA